MPNVSFQGTVLLQRQSPLDQKIPTRTRCNKCRVPCQSGQHISLQVVKHMLHSWNEETAIQSKSAKICYCGFQWWLCRRRHAVRVQAIPFRSQNNVTVASRMARIGLSFNITRPLQQAGALLNMIVEDGLDVNWRDLQRAGTDGKIFQAEIREY